MHSYLQVLPPRVAADLQLLQGAHALLSSEPLGSVGRILAVTLKGRQVRNGEEVICIFIYFFSKILFFIFIIIIIFKFKNIGSLSPLTPRIGPSKY